MGWAGTCLPSTMRHAEFRPKCRKRYGFFFQSPLKASFDVIPSTTLFGIWPINNASRSAVLVPEDMVKWRVTAWVMGYFAPGPARTFSNPICSSAANLTLRASKTASSMTISYPFTVVSKLINENWGSARTKVIFTAKLFGKSLSWSNISICNLPLRSNDLLFEIILVLSLNPVLLWSSYFPAWSSCQPSRRFSQVFFTSDP